MKIDLWYAHYTPEEVKRNEEFKGVLSFDTLAAYLKKIKYELDPDSCIERLDLNNADLFNTTNVLIPIFANKKYKAIERTLVAASRGDDYAVSEEALKETKEFLKVARFPRPCIEHIDDCLQEILADAKAYCTYGLAFTPDELVIVSGSYNLKNREREVVYHDDKKWKAYVQAKADEFKAE